MGDVGRVPPVGSGGPVGGAGETVDPELLKDVEDLQTYMGLLQVALGSKPPNEKELENYFKIIKSDWANIQPYMDPLPSAKVAVIWNNEAFQQTMAELVNTPQNKLTSNSFKAELSEAYGGNDGNNISALMNVLARM